MAYYNTTSIKSPLLAAEWERCKTQQSRIYWIIQRIGKASASDIQAQYQRLTGNYILIGSVRRAISDLKADGKVKVSGQQRGPYNKPEFIYSIN